MRNYITRTLSLLALAALVTVPASAAEINGRVLNGSDGVGGLEVRLWSLDGKNFEISNTVTTAASGAYQFRSIPGGTYRVDARMPQPMVNTWSDRWHDAADPSAGGWVDAVADDIVLNADETRNAVDIQVARVGGLEGRVLRAGTAVSNIMVRVERISQIGEHHHDFSDVHCCEAGDSYLGRFFFRGIRAAEDYRLLVFDLNGTIEPAVVGPFTVSGRDITSVGDVAVEPMGSDPYEPNNSPAAGGAASVDSSLFRADTPSPFQTFGALIGPRNEDIDYYCLETQAHDRFLAYTSTDLGIAGEFTDHPLTDIMLAFVSGDGARIIAQNDDGVGVGLNAVLDTGDIPTGGRYCFVVTTYGDTNFRGTGQESAGRYDLTIELGNRLPSVRLTVSGGPAPEPPGRAIVDEGAEFRLDFQVNDPDGDDLDVVITHVDNAGDDVELGEFVLGDDGRGTYTWDVPDDGARYAPYEITISASDGEFTAEGVVLIDPRGVNLSPSAPVPVSPEDGGTAASWTPTLVIENSVDPDNDLLTYEFEIYYGAPSAAPDEEGVVTEDLEDESGTTSYTTTPIDENQEVTWRARATDNIDESGVSPWTEFQTFVVNVENETPFDISLIKPDENATVATRTPALTAENTTDPDGDSLELTFEVATDSDFTDIIVTSEPIPQETSSSRTTWNVDPPLAWGGEYYARVIAIDPAGAATPYSNVRAFRVKNNQAPDEPTLTGDLGAQCANVVYDETAPTEFTVAPVLDPEGEAVTIDFRIYDYNADVNADAPLYQESRAQDPGHTGDHIFIVPDGLFQENGRYVVRIGASDSERESTWSECDFLINTENSPPSALVILEPGDASIFPAATDEVRVLFQNASDADNEPLTIAWCAVNTLANEACPENFRDWNKLPQATSGQTEFYLPVFAGADVALQACAYDGAGICGDLATVSFVVETEKTEVTPSLCGCSATAGNNASTKGWLLLWGAVFVAMRRRRAS